VLGWQVRARRYGLDALIVCQAQLAQPRLPGWQDGLMPQEPPSPTDPSREADMGRIALWLDPDDLRWLAARCRCDDEATDMERERCARIRFRAHTALHKATTDSDLETDTRGSRSL